MLKKGWNQSVLARQAAMHMPNGLMTRQGISTYVMGKHMPDQTRLEAIAKALEVEPYDLVRSPMVEWIGSGKTPGEAIGNAAREPIYTPGPSPLPIAPPVPTDGMSLDFAAGKVHLRVDKMVDPATALKVMALLTSSDPN
jgi:transcriptional regulator with XRE-family HTH domain